MLIWGKAQRKERKERNMLKLLFHRGRQINTTTDTLLAIKKTECQNSSLKCYCMFRQLYSLVGGTHEWGNIHAKLCLQPSYSGSDFSHM